MSFASVIEQHNSLPAHRHLALDDEPLAHVTYEYLGIDPTKFYRGRFVSDEMMLTDPASRYAADYARARFLAKHIHGGRVLDLGCGAGPYGRMLKEQCGVAELVGVDSDPACAALAARSYDDVQAVRIEERLPFPDSYFDAVFSLDFFGHVEFRHKNRLIAEVARVTRPGGLSLHAIESGEIDYHGVDPTNPNDPVICYARRDGHVGVEPGTAIRRRWQRCFENVVVEIAYLYSIMPLESFSAGACGTPELMSLIRDFGPRERRAAGVCLGFVGDYLKEIIRRMDPNLLIPCAEAELHSNEYSAEWLMRRLFHTEGGLVYLTARKAGNSEMLLPAQAPRLPFYESPLTERIVGSLRWWSQRMHYWLFEASAEMRRRRASRFAAETARRFHPIRAYRWLKRQPRRVRESLRRRFEARAASRACRLHGDLPRGYDVLCLPVMPWNTRVQRPQQLMRLFAEHGHRVYYAGLEFRGGNAAAVTEVSPGVFETILPGTSGINVYGRTPTADEVARMVAAIDRLRAERRITSAVVVAQLPFWTALALELRKRFGWPIVYECMDDHTEFSTNSKQMFHAENLLIAEADLAVVSSDVLWNKVQPRAVRTVMIRNACEYEHFAAAEPKADAVSHAARRLAPPESITVGFFGAVADWFDSDLIADLAEMRPGWKFELIGSTHTGKIERLEKLPNVALLGEKPYNDLPRLMAHWDCHLIPFRRIPLTEAMNPVKAYEIMATGKPLVATNLPELRPMAREELLTLADDAPGFAAAIERELTEDNPQQRERRREYAAANTWQRRWEDYDAAIREMFPLASIITPTFNNLPLNKAWLHGILTETDYPNYEIIVIDNNSTDGTAQWLAEVAQAWQDETAGIYRPRIQVILNKENRGFAAANNQALSIARGQYLCLLNNDTIVTHGWLSTLIGHLRKDPKLGMVGPVSNNVGNEAKVPVGYRDIAKMPRWAEDYCRRHDGQIVPIEMLGFFCAVMPREVFRRVGDLDERFGLGYFEDDDYCRRVREAGYQMCFARDAFVHHWLESSFRLLGRDAYIRQYSKNQRLYKDKWNADDAAHTHSN